MRTTLHQSEPKCTAPSARRGEGGDEDRDHHCRCIHRHAVHKPAAAPSMMSGAVKKMPVFNVQSSQRPITTPIRIGRDDRPAEHADLAEARGE